MSFSARYLPVVLFAILGLATSLCAQTATKQSNKTPRGSVSGRVTIKEKGAAGVVVGMQRSDRSTPYEPYLKATTDPDGFYRLTNVAPGSYQIFPAMPAHVFPDSNGGRGTTVLVGEDENVEGIDFALVRGGVIAGKVTDADDHPVIQQPVSVYLAESLARRAAPGSVYAVKSVQTDDRGIYRIFGLNVGRYKVAVGRGDLTLQGSYSPSRSSYRQVFHPDVSDQANAKIIEVSEGSEAADVDIKLGHALQTFAVAGRVVNGENGLPVPNIRLVLQRSIGQRPELVTFPATSNVQGDFILEGLIPGKYGVSLMQNQSDGMRSETTSFEITDQDVNGVIVKLVRGASINGVVVLETDDKTAFEKLSQLEMRGFVQAASSGPGYGGSATSPIAPDGSFRLTGLPPGTANIMLGPTGRAMLPKGFVVARVERDGIVTPPGVQIKEGEQVFGVRVIVFFGTATLRGVVKVENGSLPEGASFFVRVLRPGEALSGLRSPRVDARGHFLLDGVPPGTYEIVASLAGRTTQINSVKREVTLQDGVVTEVVLTIDMGQQPPKP
jgi:hypothetical protein